MVIVDFAINQPSAEFLQEIAESEFWHDLPILVLIKRPSYENIKFLEEIGLTLFVQAIDRNCLATQS